MFFSLVKAKLPKDITVHPYATATSPDQIIAEAMKVSMAKDITAWYKGPNRSRYKGVSDYHPTYHYELGNKDRSLVLTWTDYSYESTRLSSFQVNDIDFDPGVALALIASYDTLKAAYDRAEATARKAKLAMQANENKWNLAESLLGLERNEFGALVPKETV